MALTPEANSEAMESIHLDGKQRLEDDDDKILRSRLQEGRTPVSKDMLQKALSRARRGLFAQHSSATSIWRAPISLFGEIDNREAVRRGVPAWAINTVCRVQQLVEEAAALDNCTDNYEAQIESAFVQGRGIDASRVLLLLEQLDSLAAKLQAEMKCLQEARVAFDEPRQAVQSEATHQESNRPTLATAAAGKEVCDLEVPIIQPAKPKSTLWRSVVEVGKKVKSRAAPPAELQASLNAQISAAGRSSRDMVRGALESASRFGEGVRLHGLGAELTPLIGIRNPRTLAAPQPPAWYQVTGRPSAWLCAEDVVGDRRALDARLQLHDLDNTSREAQSRWERCCRGSERRWSLP